MSLRLFDLEYHLVLYGSYHNKPVNVIIHIVCVPILIASAHVLLSNFLLPIPTISGSIPNTVSFVISVIYALYYTLLEPFAGFFAGLFSVGSSLYASRMIALHGSTATTWALAIHVLAWIAQFVGHGKFEKRAPALLDNPLQAVVLAPLFVWMEVLFAVGYRAELQERVHKGVQEKITEFERESGKVRQE